MKQTPLPKEQRVGNLLGMERVGPWHFRAPEGAGWLQGREQGGCGVRKGGPAPAKLTASEEQRSRFSHILGRP